MRTMGGDRSAIRLVRGTVLPSPCNPGHGGFPHPRRDVTVDAAYPRHLMSHAFRPQPARSR
jgi:hypothetical protein